MLRADCMANPRILGLEAIAIRLEANAIRPGLLVCLNGSWFRAAGGVPPPFATDPGPFLRSETQSNPP